MDHFRIQKYSRGKMVCKRKNDLITDCKAEKYEKNVNCI